MSSVLIALVLVLGCSLSSGSPQSGVLDAQEKGLQDSYKEGYFKAKGRAKADHDMSAKLKKLRAKEQRGKMHFRKQEAALRHVRVSRKAAMAHAKKKGAKQQDLDNLVVPTNQPHLRTKKMSRVQSKEVQGKKTLRKQEATLHNIRHATHQAMSSAKRHGVSSTKIDKLKTKEKLVKIRNGNISHEIHKDVHALQKAKAVHNNAVASKKQKLDAMKGEVRGLLFLKALKDKAKLAGKVLAKQRNQKQHPVDSVNSEMKAGDHVVMLDESSGAPHYWGELEGTARLYAHREKVALRRWQVEGVAVKESKVKRVKRGEVCACNGVENKHGHGAVCKDWQGDGTHPWCYVNYACSKGTTARDMSGVKWRNCRQKQAQT